MNDNIEVLRGLVAQWLAECDRLNGGYHAPFTNSENSITALALNRCAYELAAALGRGEG